MPRSHPRPYARTPSREPRNRPRELRLERRRRAPPGFLPRSGSRPRAGFLAARRTLGRAWCGAGGLRLERCNARLQDLILVTRGGSHGLYGFELVAADEILAPNPLAEFLASARLCL